MRISNKVFDFKESDIKVEIVPSGSKTCLIVPIPEYDHLNMSLMMDIDEEDLADYVFWRIGCEKYDLPVDARDSIIVISEVVYKLKTIDFEDDVNPIVLEMKHSKRRIHVDLDTIKDQLNQNNENA